MARHLAVLLSILIFGTGAMPRVPAAGLPPAFVLPPILMYHRVDVDRPADAVGRELTISPARFAGQLAYLKSRGITGISMEQLQERLKSGAPLDHVVVLTFDDGYADQYTYALSLLRRYRDAATFYIITSTVDEPRHLTWSQLRRMRALGQDIAAHGVVHDDLSLMPGPEQRLQIDGSLRLLRQQLHAAVTSYAFPSGRFNRRTLQLVRQAGVDFAVTTDRRYVIAPENRFELPRVRVMRDWTSAQFGDALQAAVEDAGVVRR